MTRLIGVVARAAEALATACFFGFFAAILAQIAYRYLGITIIFSEELARLLNVYVVFIGLVAVTHLDGHIRIDLIDRLLAARPLLQVFLHVLYLIGALVFLAILFVGAGTIMVNNWGWRLATMPWLHQGHIYLAPFVGSGLTILVLLAKIGERIREFRRLV